MAMPTTSDTPTGAVFDAYAMADRETGLIGVLERGGSARVLSDRAEADFADRLSDLAARGRTVLAGLAAPATEACLNRLRRHPWVAGSLCSWPDGSRIGGALVVAGIDPARLIPPPIPDDPAARIRAMVRHAARLDDMGRLARLLLPPSGAPVPGADWVRDPAEIYRRSFAAIRAEADLALLPETMRDVAIRLIHACGMIDLVQDLSFSPDAAHAGRQALAAGAPILADAAMVAHGIIRRRLPAANPVLCRLDDPTVPALAENLATTRSAAAVELWRPDLGGAVVAIGNAPTALFRLLEIVAAGAPSPALVLGFPVGFVGAAESKQALVESGLPFVTVLGRRGGSALAAAAVNALAGGLE